MTTLSLRFMSACKDGQTLFYKFNHSVSVKKKEKISSVGVTYPAASIKSNRSWFYPGLIYCLIRIRVTFFIMADISFAIRKS